MTCLRWDNYRTAATILISTIVFCYCTNFLFNDIRSKNELTGITCLCFAGSTISTFILCIAFASFRTK